MIEVDLHRFLAGPGVGVPLLPALVFRLGCDAQLQRQAGPELASLVQRLSVEHVALPAYERGQGAVLRRGSRLRPRLRLAAQVFEWPNYPE